MGAWRAAHGCAGMKHVVALFSMLRACFNQTELHIAQRKTESEVLVLELEATALSSRRTSTCALESPTVTATRPPTASDMSWS